MRTACYWVNQTVTIVKWAGNVISFRPAECHYPSRHFHNQWHHQKHKCRQVFVHSHLSYIFITKLHHLQVQVTRSHTWSHYFPDISSGWPKNALCTVYNTEMWCALFHVMQCCYTLAICVIVGIFSLPNWNNMTVWNCTTQMLVIRYELFEQAVRKLSSEPI